MQILTLGRKQIDFHDYVRRGALEGDVGRAVTEPCKLFDKGGNLIGIYDELNADTEELAQTCQRIRYITDTRIGGLVTTSRIFGNEPRVERRARNFCHRTSLAREQPDENAIVCGTARHISERYRLMTPDVFSKHEQMTAGVKPEWVIPGSVFTSGIINKNNALSYHFDAGNFEHVMSAMLVLRKNMDGGWLNLPEFDTRFLLKNNAIFMFDGQDVLHGVTPMTPNADDGYRYSLVFYSLRRMWKCLTLTEELAQARNREMAKFR